MPGTEEDEKAKKQAALKAWQEKLTAQKEQVSMASRELDVTQREYQLRAAAMYADAGNRLRNSVQWDKEEATYKQQLADKQKALDEAKQKLEDMKEEAVKAGIPSSDDRVMLEHALDAKHAAVETFTIRLGKKRRMPDEGSAFSVLDWITQSSVWFIERIAQTQQLFSVMHSVEQVKLSPLPGAQRTENGMIEQRNSAAEAPFTLLDDRIHGGDLRA